VRAQKNASSQEGPLKEGGGGDRRLNLRGDARCYPEEGRKRSGKRYSHQNGALLDDSTLRSRPDSMLRDLRESQHNSQGVRVKTVARMNSPSRLVGRGYFRW